ncbi:Peptidase family S41 [Marivirga sericea]|uniref:Peptidase family S41 n=1 Tax=Marivirga sericea TaxID=1028 RepID=A0A1X7L0I5_9BACT|nr:S41 family peptidase [Marivirga sericea]SMG47127.1 Peptidase family S41 [Marivirga sericea]
MQSILKTLFILVFFTLMINTVKSQNCKCSDSFDQTVQTYEQDYSLFQFKVTDENRKLYKAHTALMRQKAMQQESVADCKQVLEQWLDFFRDGHTYIGISTETELNSEKIKISEKRFKSDYKKLAYHKNPLLGIWTSKAYTVAIIPNPEGREKEVDFVGVLLESTNDNWSKDDVKFELTTVFGNRYDAQFYMGNHSPRTTTAEQQNTQQLSFRNNIGDWTKVWPATDMANPISEVDLKFNQFHFTEVEGIPYLRFPDFFTVEPAYVDSIVKANHDKLIAADFIIVDVRDNNGGNDATYYPVLPYILNGPIKIPNSGLWMSKANIALFLESSGLEEKPLEEYDEEEREMYDYVMSLEGTAFFQNPDYDSTYEPDTIYSPSQKVILLTDENTVSSGETFVFRANQSDKVVVYGQNTAGIIDGFNGLTKNIGCFDLTYPSSFRASDLKDNPIDPYGIAPDVFVDKDVDVLSYSIEHMKELIQQEK